MKQRLKSLVLSVMLLLLFSWISFSNFPKDAQKVVADDETTTIVACSDFQPYVTVEVLYSKEKLTQICLDYKTALATVEIVYDFM